MTRPDDPETDLAAMTAVLGHAEDGGATGERGAALDAAVPYWEDRFAPLLDVAEPVAPSPGLWRRIAARTIEAAAHRPVRRSPLARGFERAWNSVGAWRIATAAALAAAVVLGAPRREPPGGPALVAVLQSPEERKAGFLVEVAADRTLSLLPLSETRPPAGRALQFWTKADRDAGPTSLGLVAGDAVTRIEAGPRPVEPGQLFEVTLEPAAGSPIGRPTGPILYLGRAVAAPDKRAG